MPDRHPADHYEAAVHRVVRLVDRASDAAWERPLPPCPEWTVGDVIRHVAGLAADVVAGEVDGYAGTAWTQRQVDRRRSSTWADVRAEWLDVLPALVTINRDLAGSALPDMVNHSIGLVPKTSFEQAFTVDLVQHELDLHSAIDPLEAVPIDSLELILRAQVSTLRGVFAMEGLPTIVLRPSDIERELAIGRDEPAAVVEAPMLDLVRSLGGRRTIDQIRALGWSALPDDRVAAAMVVPFFSLPAEPVE